MDTTWTCLSCGSRTTSPIPVVYPCDPPEYDIRCPHCGGTRLDDSTPPVQSRKVTAAGVSGLLAQRSTSRERAIGADTAGPVSR